MVKTGNMICVVLNFCYNFFMKPTPYDDINNVLGELTKGTVSIFGDKLIGVYLSGSLSYGDFVPGRSDIDLFCILKTPVTKEEVEELRKFHAKIEQDNPKWAKRIESQYIPIEMFKSKEPPTEPRPWLGEGVLYPNSCFGNEWLINNYLLYHHGVTLFGPEIKTIIKPVNIEEVRKAAIKDLYKEWEPKLNDPEFFKNAHYHSYVVLNLCRILYTVLNAKAGSKKEAVEWVKKDFPEWKDLTEAAENWKHGDKMDYDNETKEFIEFVVGKIKYIDV
jgi:hypothetical protein